MSEGDFTRAYAPGNVRVLFEAATCREAAEVVKMLADNATEGVWGVGNGDTIAVDVEQTSRGSFTSGGPPVAVMSDERWDDPGDVPINPADAVDDAAYIAIMQPSVGRALATLLEHAGVEALRTGALPDADVFAVAQAVVAVKYPLAEQVRYDLTLDGEVTG